MFGVFSISLRSRKNPPASTPRVVTGALVVLFATACDTASDDEPGDDSESRFADFEFTRWLSQSTTGQRNEWVNGPGTDLDQTAGSCGGTAELTVTPASGAPLVFEADIDPYSIWTGGHCGQGYIAKFELADSEQELLALRANAGFKVPKPVLGLQHLDQRQQLPSTHVCQRRPRGAMAGLRSRRG